MSFSPSCQNVKKHDTRGTNQTDVMDPELGTYVDLGDGAELEACSGAYEDNGDETEAEGGWFQNATGGDGALSSASTFSDSSLPSSSSSTLPGGFPSVHPIYVDEEKEMLSGCSKSFNGLKLFMRR